MSDRHSTHRSRAAKRRSLSALLCGVLGFGSTAASADTFLGLYAGAGHWASDFTGDFSSDGDEIDLEDDLSFGEDSTNMVYVALEHPIPLVPNLRIQGADISIKEDSVLSRQVVYGDETYNASENIVTELDLTHFDATLYYEVLDNVVSLDLGLTVRQFDGVIELESQTLDKTERVEVDEPLPMLYAMAQFDLPFSGLYAGAEVNWISYSGSSMLDAKAKLGYLKSIIGVELGYRAMQITLDDVNDLDTDINIGGFYTSLVLHI